MEIEQFKIFLEDKIEKLETQKRKLEIDYNWTIAEKTTHQNQLYEINYNNKICELKKNVVEIITFLLGIISVVVSLPIMFSYTQMSLLLINVIGIFEIIGVSFLPEIVSNNLFNSKKELINNKIIFDEIEKLEIKEEKLEESINKLNRSIEYIMNYLIAIKEYLENDMTKEVNIEKKDQIKTDLIFSRKRIKK